MEQYEKCPMKIVEEYKNMKKNIELDFINYIAEWFKMHPYVDKLFISEYDSILANSMFLHSNRNICCDITIKN